uniref:Uncharacterized protein n=1 Tax=Theropithecus gelada TaxID=9565 RepID=A0A8D2F0X5_THEGE
VLGSAWFPGISPRDSCSSVFKPFIGKTLTTDDSICVLGISKRNVIFQPVPHCCPPPSLHRHRIPKERWWLKLWPLMKILAKYKASYNVSDSGRLEHHPLTRKQQGSKKREM